MVLRFLRKSKSGYREHWQTEYPVYSNHSASSNKLPEFPTPAEYAAYTRAAQEVVNKRHELETNYGYQHPPNQRSMNAKLSGNSAFVPSESRDYPRRPRRRPVRPPSPDGVPLSTHDIFNMVKPDVDKMDTDLAKENESSDSATIRSSLDVPSPTPTVRLGTEENTNDVQTGNLTSTTLESAGEIFDAEATIQDQVQIQKLLNDLGATKLDFKVTLLVCLHLKYPDLVQKAKFRLQTTSTHDQTNHWTTGHDKTIICDGWIDYGGYSDVYQV